MVNGAKRQVSHLRLILQSIPKLARADSIERVYGITLDEVQAIFKPNRLFVALSESKNLVTNAQAAQRGGWLHDLIIPIHAGGNLVGKIMLQFDKPRSFSNDEITSLELIAAQAGLAIERIDERKSAGEARRRKDELVAMAVHELRSPLTAIVGAAFILRKGREEQRIRALEVIERNAQAQVNLIEDLLHVWQLDTGQLKLQFRTLDLVPILQKVIEDIRPLATSHSTVLNADFKQALTVRGDEQRLWQVFWNLLANSVRFASPNGEVRITAEYGSAVIRICIRDNGIGIGEKELPYIFEPFRQGRGQDVKPHAGIGLGLAIVKDLVALHKGAISAESDGPGKGACFTVTLPSAS
jgi:signal transduction histidine kinase